MYLLTWKDISERVSYKRVQKQYVNEAKLFVEIDKLILKCTWKCKE